MPLFENYYLELAGPYELTKHLTQQIWERTGEISSEHEFRKRWIGHTWWKPATSGTFRLPDTAFNAIYKNQDKEGDPKTPGEGKLEKTWNLLERVGEEMEQIAKTTEKHVHDVCSSGSSKKVKKKAHLVSSENTTGQKLLTLIVLPQLR